MTYERVRSLERFTRPEHDCCAKMLRLVVPNPDGSLREDYRRCTICGQEVEGLFLVLCREYLTVSNEPAGDDRPQSGSKCL